VLGVRFRRSRLQEESLPAMSGSSCSRTIRRHPSILGTLGRWRLRTSSGRQRHCWCLN